MSKYDYKLRVSANTNVCVGAGLCVTTASHVFDQRDEDGIVDLLQAEPDEQYYEDVESAARKCPSKAISVQHLAKTEG
jgi:ferredoxin